MSMFVILLNMLRKQHTKNNNKRNRFKCELRNNRLVSKIHQSVQ